MDFVNIKNRLVFRYLGDFRTSTTENLIVLLNYKWLHVYLKITKNTDKSVLLTTKILIVE